MTLLAALRCDRIDAPWVLDGPINGESFRVYVEHVLVPALAQGDIVVMDNLGSHKGKAIRRAIRAAGGEAILPAALQSRSQPDRAGVRQAEAFPAKSRRAHRPRHVGAHWISPRRLQSRRMRKLFRQLRIRYRVESSRSRTKLADEPFRHRRAFRRKI